MILDTTALSGFLKADPSIHVHLASSSSCSIPAIVLGEYRFGVLHSKHPQLLENKLKEVLEDVQILPIEEVTTIEYADIRSGLKKAGTPIPEHDLWIAALVRQYGLPLLSRDSHFNLVRGVDRISW